MLLEPQDSMDGFCLSQEGPKGCRSLKMTGRLCSGLQATGIKSELLLPFPQAEMVFDSP